MFEYLGTIAPARRLAWDCATGNGQAAVELANVFDRVIATDASEGQIANAEPRERVEYRVAPAEKSGLETAKFDIVMVAQALHWLNHNQFYPEVGRVLKEDGVFAASAYNHLRTDKLIKEIIKRYYYEIVGPYWPPERALIEKFSEIPFPFPERKTLEFEIAAEWNLEHLMVICGHGRPRNVSLRQQIGTRSMKSQAILKRPGAIGKKSDVSSGR